MMSDVPEVVDAIRVKDGAAGRVVGQSLRSLRQAAGFTQRDMAERLGIGQAAVSRIERRRDIRISSLQRYVEALGASLRIDAVFPDRSHFQERLQPEIGGTVATDDQYIFPIFGDEVHPPPPKRDIIISIKPKYTGKILSGAKTIELRRRFPLSIPPGSVAFIYSTSPEMALVGAIRIENVECLSISTIWEKYSSYACIKRPNFNNYFCGLDRGFAIGLSYPRRFSNPLTLVELRDRFGFKAPQSFLYAKPDLQRAIRNEYTNIPD